MTQQFKFGDIVRIKETGYTGSVIDFKFGVVVASHGDTSIDTFDSDELEPIPHPDTVRLDWLVKNDCALTERLCDEDGDRLDTPFAVIQKVEEHFELLADACDIRQAIDAAMRQETV